VGLQPSFSKGLCIHLFPSSARMARSRLEGGFFSPELLCIHDVPLCAEKPYDVMTPLVVVVVIVVCLFLKEIHTLRRSGCFLLFPCFSPFPLFFFFLGSLISFSKGHLFCGRSGNSFFESSMRGFWASRRVGTFLLFERGLRKFGRISAFSFRPGLPWRFFGGREGGDGDLRVYCSWLDDMRLEWTGEVSSVCTRRPCPCSRVFACPL